jgi:hypothetical protein
MKITMNELRKVVRQVVEQKKKEKGWLDMFVDAITTAAPLGQVDLLKRGMDSIEKPKAKKKK